MPEMEIPVVNYSRI